MRSDHWRNEADFVPESVEDLAELRRRIIAAGYSASVANGLLGWLVSKGAGEADVTESKTRSKYRKILAELGAPEGPSGGRLQVVAPAAPASRRRQVPGVRRLGAVVVALAMALGAGASQANTEASSGASGAAGAAPKPPRIHGPAGVPSSRRRKAA